MNITELAFPVLPESFIAYQEALIGRQLAEDERMATGHWIPILNWAYTEGQNGGTTSLPDALDLMDRFLRESEDHPAQMQFLEACRRWIAYAWSQGRQQGAGKAVMA